ncbi:MAG: glycine--tRNA ligase subunit alpha [Alphaproteobacteria bacterium]|nr:glycine--tRNA ligase subunit alpha [Alphaproteobacteria bacterium]
MVPRKSFQEIIKDLQEYWHDKGCVILQPYDLELGAGTFHPATTLWALSKDPYSIAYVQPSRRPKDSRFGENPNRLYKHHQFQVILKPAPSDIQELYLNSLRHIGLDPSKHDIRFVEDDWESPTLGASGLGWEVWCDGSEVSQFTYMQQIGGIECKMIPGEITYGLERLALYIQGKDNVYDLDFNNSKSAISNKTYGDIFKRAEYEFSEYALNKANTDVLLKNFNELEEECENLISSNLPLPAYEQCIKASNVFNLLDARGVISVTERAYYISRVRNMAKQCCEIWIGRE